MKHEHNLFSSNSKDACQEYKEWKESGSDTLQEINDVYNANQKYLDNEFRNEFPREFFSRLLELFVLKKICSSSFGSKLQAKEKSSEEGPDFKINNFIDSKNLYVECICPKPAEVPFKEGTFKIEEETDGDSVSGASSGLDYHSITRFTNALESKSKKFDTYLKKGIVKSKDYKMICVLTYHVGQEKTKMYNTSTHACASAEFRAAIFGEEQYYFENGTGKHGVEYKDLKIKKPHSVEPVDVGFQDYLNIFNIIVACNILPFFGSSSRVFDFYYGSDKIELEIASKCSKQDFLV